MPDLGAALAFGLPLVGVIAMAALGRAHQRRAQAARDRTLRSPFSNEVLNPVKERLAQGKKIQAIKVLREMTGLGLAEAKDVVEDIAAGRVPAEHADHPVAEPPVAEPSLAAHPSKSAPDNLAEHVRKLRDAGRETEAIRLVCDHTGMGILDAQKFVRTLG